MGLLELTISAYQVENFARNDYVVERVHDFLDGRVVVPPMEVQNVDVCGSELLQTGFNRYVEILGIVADVRPMLHSWLDSMHTHLVVTRVLEHEMSAA